MDRVVRFIGVVAVLALTFLAYRYYDRSVGAIDDADEVGALAAVDAGGGPAAGLGADTGPRYRNFLPRWPPRIYLVDASAADRARTGEGTDGKAGDGATSGATDGADDGADATPGEATADRTAEVVATGSGGSGSGGSTSGRTGLIHGSLIGFGRIPPGLYATDFDTVGCQYHIQRADEDGRLRSIGQDSLDRGRALVSIDPIEADVFAAVPQCGRWSEWSPLIEPLEVAGSGDYWVGDLARGTWIVADGCLWEKVVGFRGARLADVMASGRGPGFMIVDDTTLGIRVRGCERPMVLAAPSA